MLPQPQPQPRKRLTLYQKTLITILAAILLAVIGTCSIISAIGFSRGAFPIRNFRVTGHSMQPSLQPDQVIWASSLTYMFSKPQRGDIVVYNTPPPTPANCQYAPATSVLLVDRIIATPGDTITITSNSVILNGATLTEPYIAPLPSGVAENYATLPTTKLGPNQYFLLGDNRPISIDSRCFGPVPFQNIVGRML